MTTLLKPRAPSRMRDGRPRGGHVPGRAGGRPDERRPTLEERLTGAWRDAAATGTTSCPVCGGAMEHHGSSADCADCGTRLR